MNAYMKNNSFLFLILTLSFLFCNPPKDNNEDTTNAFVLSTLANSLTTRPTTTTTTSTTVAPTLEATTLNSVKVTTLSSSTRERNFTFTSGSSGNYYLSVAPNSINDRILTILTLYKSQETFNSSTEVFSQTDSSSSDGQVKVQALEANTSYTLKIAPVGSNSLTSTFNLSVLVNVESPFTGGGFCSFLTSVCDDFPTSFATFSTNSSCTLATAANKGQSATCAQTYSGSRTRVGRCTMFFVEDSVIARTTSYYSGTYTATSAQSACSNNGSARFFTAE